MSSRRTTRVSRTSRGQFAKKSSKRLLNEPCQKWVYIKRHPRGHVGLACWQWVPLDQLTRSEREQREGKTTLKHVQEPGYNDQQQQQNYEQQHGQHEDLERPHQDEHDEYKNNHIQDENNIDDDDDNNNAAEHLIEEPVAKRQKIEVAEEEEDELEELPIQVGDDGAVPNIDVALLDSFTF